MINRNKPTTGANAHGRRGLYGHMRNPVGLIYRMLRSRDRAALSTLYQAGLKVPCTAIDRLLQPLEAKRLRECGNNLLPIVLIVGPSRGGTTLVSQVLSQSLPVSYFDNWGAMFPRSTITASLLFKRYSGGPPPSSHSYYGHTAGFRGVNDGFHLWNRWMGDDRYSLSQDIGKHAREEMRRFFVAWSEAFGRPILNKNNRNAFYIELLASVLETAIFVVVTREPVYVAQSLLLARERLQGNDSAEWGLGAHRPGSTPQPSPLEDVADQVRFVYERLNEQLDRVPRERIVHVRYEEFCNEPVHLVAQVDAILRARSPNSKLFGSPLPTMLDPLTNTNTMQLPRDRFDKLNALLRGVSGVVSS